jgi:hypothetical protein
LDADLSKIEFNRNQKTDSAAIGVISAVRILLVALVLNIGLATLGILAMIPTPPPVVAAIPGLVFFAMAVVCFGATAYGSFCLAESLGWAGWISAVMIFGALIPYLRLLMIIGLIVQGIVVVSQSKYRFSLFGLEKRAAA